MKSTKTKKKKEKVLPSTSNIVNIEAAKDALKTIKGKDSYFSMSMYQDNNLLITMDEYVRFIKAVEKMVRTSSFYKDYISMLKMSGFNYCMVLGNIDDTDGIDIEMHHSLFTLFDVASIITNYSLYQGLNVSTFKIADEILKCHYYNMIPVTMLCKTVHELVHKGKIYIHFSQMIGNVELFINRYEEGFTEELIIGFNELIKLHEKYEKGSDNNLLMFNGIKSWNKTNNDNIDIDFI